MKKERTKQLSYALRERLEHMAAYGESKRTYKLRTLDMRREARNSLIRQGVPADKIQQKLLHIDAAKDKIFSFSTMSSYIRFVKDFARFVETKTGTSRIKVEESIQYIQPYIEHLKNKGDSANTINLKLSAVCKATGQFVVDYQHPIRRYADVIRGVKPAVRDNFNSKRAAAALELNSAVGLRRAELYRLKVDDITWGKGHAVIKSIGKGGKHNSTFITDCSKLAILEKYYMDALENGRDTLLSSEQMNHDADLHHARAQCAMDEYKRVMEDIKEHPERRIFYKDYVVRFFKENNKPLKENLDKPYNLRGAGKKMLEKQGRETSFDRVAVLYVSVTILHHYRSDTTVQHYLIK
ncbi:Phage integrase, N-terminal SAM-like domain [Ruminococcaceae bacterium FB2012]|nr:Phage integrase, N-terminal SAM-like domain [Ruminococcaceae bacterium FB2012]